MTHTYRGSIVSRAIKDFINLNKGNLGFQEVNYGDRDRFPLIPAVCVEPAITTRELTGANYVTDNTFTVNILVYHTSIDGVEVIQEECDDLSEALQDAINKESIHEMVAGGTRFGNIIIHGHVVRLEYGYKMLGDKLMRCNRLIWQGRSKTHIVEV